MDFLHGRRRIYARGSNVGFMKPGINSRDELPGGFIGWVVVILVLLVFIFGGIGVIIGFVVDIQSHAI